MHKLKDINWNHLYCFYEVARAQSLKKGAESLGTASSTISEQIKKMESTFQMKLFHRSSKGLMLTNGGLELFERVKVIFEEGSRILEHFSDDLVGGYPVVIGIEETISYDLATEFASQYWDSYVQYGTVNTIRQTGHEALVENLMVGQIDWGISLRKPKRKELQYSRVGAFEIVFCCLEDLYNKFVHAKDLLTSIPFVESTWDKSLNQAVLGHLRQNGVVPKEKIYSDHPDFVKKLCDRGRCVMFMPNNPLREYPGMKIFQFNEPLTISIYAIWKKENEGLVSIRELRNLISSNIEKLPERYEDVDLQIEASDVSDDMLTRD